LWGAYPLIQARGRPALPKGKEEYCPPHPCICACSTKDFKMEKFYFSKMLSICKKFPRWHFLKIEIITQ